MKDGCRFRGNLSDSETHLKPIFGNFTTYLINSNFMLLGMVRYVINTTNITMVCDYNLLYFSADHGPAPKAEWSMIVRTDCSLSPDT